MTPPVLDLTFQVCLDVLVTTPRALSKLSLRLTATRHSLVCSMGPSDYPDMALDVHSMPPQTFGPYAAPTAMAGGRDQASYSFPPQTQPCSYPGAANPYTDAELKRLEILRLEEARRDRDREDRKEREVCTPRHGGNTGGWVGGTVL